MKAAVLHAFGEPPRYEEFPEPTAGPGEVLLRVKASALTQLARSTARGSHYARPTALPCGVGVDGAGTLPDGTRVYANGPRSPYGMMGELTVVPRDRCVPVPEYVDDVRAAALPNAALASWLALAHRTKLAPGETVLILGATGVAGKVAIRVARHLGAGRVVAAGRNEDVLKTLPGLGADATLSLDQSDDALAAALAKEDREHPIDVVVDFVWGPAAGVALRTFTGRGHVESVRRARYVSVGSMAGPVAPVPSEPFRSSGLELVGSGIGSVPVSAVIGSLPKIWELARAPDLPLSTESVPLASVAEAWDRPEPGGVRRVFVP